MGEEDSGISLRQKVQHVIFPIYQPASLKTIMLMCQYKCIQKMGFQCIHIKTTLGYSRFRWVQVWLVEQKTVRK